MQTSIVFGPKFQEEGGKKCLHLSRGLLRNETGVKWYSVGLTMTSIAGEVTQLTQLSNRMFFKDIISSSGAASKTILKRSD